MTITLFPFDDGAFYSASLFPDAILRALLGDDPQNRFVLPRVGDAFALSGTSSPITVGSGAAFINGKFCYSDAGEEANAPTPAAATRIDVIALEVDYVNKTKNAAIVRVAGEEGGAEPSLTWTPGTKCQAKLGTVSITTGGVCTCAQADNLIRLPTDVDADMILDGVIDVDHLSSGIDGATKEFNADKVDGYHASDIISGGVLSGAIIMWSGALGGSDGHRPVVGGVPNEDWHICNGDLVGAAQTPDLRDRFVVGAGTGYNVGNTGGYNAIYAQHNHAAGTLATALAGQHNHTIPTAAITYQSGATGAIVVTGVNTGTEGNHTHQPLSGNTADNPSVPVENRPPYYAVYFIMKVA